MRGELLTDFLHVFSQILHSTRAFFRLFNIKSYVYSFNVSDLFSHIQTVFNSSEKGEKFFFGGVKNCILFCT